MKYYTLPLLFSLVVLLVLTGTFSHLSQDITQTKEILTTSIR